MGESPENRTFIVPVKVEQEEDGRWSAWVEALPGCAVWGHSREEALRALNDAAQAYIEVLLEKGKNSRQRLKQRTPRSSLCLYEPVWTSRSQALKHSRP